MVRFVWPGWWLGLLVGAESPVAAQANVIPPRVELKENYPIRFSRRRRFRSRSIRRYASGVINQSSA
jgi:hypothetical protein